MAALCAATLGVGASPSAARVATVRFPPGTDTIYTFPPVPDGFAYDRVSVYVKGADGGGGANGSEAGLGGDAFGILQGGTGAAVRVIVGTLGSEETRNDRRRVASPAVATA